MLIAPLDGHVSDSAIQYPSPKAAGLYRLNRLIFSPPVLYSHPIDPSATRHQAAHAKTEFACTYDQISPLHHRLVPFQVDHGSRLRQKHLWPEAVLSACIPPK